MKIYGYFANVPDLNLEDELRLSLLWRERWAAVGFEPVVLNEWIARKHPLFANLDAAVSKLPTTNPVLYERACYLRWIALAQVGGGWLCDFDCLPAGDTDELHKLFFNLTGGQRSKLRVHQTPCCPALAYCHEQNAARLCEVFIEGKSGNRPQNGRSHFSDQYAIEDLLVAKADWVEAVDVVKLYSDAGWEKAPVVHFANAVMMGKGMVPRWKHIPKILK